MRALLLFLLFSLVFGEEYLLKGKLPENLKPFLKKTISKGIYLLDIPESALTKQSLNNIFILEKNVELKALKLPNDLCFPLRWDLKAVEAPQAWDRTTGSETVYVAIFDTGVDYEHPDLKGNLWKNPDEICNNGIDDDGNGYVDDCYGVNVLCYPNGYYDPNAPGCTRPDAYDDDGHGTFVAGILGAVGNNGFLIPGVAWKVKIIPCKFLNNAGQGKLDGELDCFEYIKLLEKDKGIKVVAINASYGGEYPFSQIQYDAIKSFNGVYITAAGNSGENNDLKEFYPCNYRLDNEICVGAYDENKKPAYFSDYGYYTVDIFAPGDNILGLYLGKHTNSCRDSLLVGAGTSLSAPFATGAVALLYSLRSNLSPIEVKREILLTGENSESFYGKSYTCNLLNLNNLLSGESSQKMCLSTKELNFGTVNTGESKTLSLTVRSTGKKDLVITNITTSKRAFKVVQENCTQRTLKPFEECSIQVSFNPQKGGGYIGTMYVYDSEGNVRSVSLHGQVQFLSNNQTASVNSPSQNTSTFEGSSGGGGGCNTGANFYIFTLLLIFLKRIFKKRA